MLTIWYNFLDIGSLFENTDWLFVTSLGQFKNKILTDILDGLSIQHIVYSLSGE